MITHDLWPWLGLLGLGAYHGLNPGMGWLFAVALGLQEKSRSALYRALLPMALGHALATGLVVLLMAGIGVVLPHAVVRGLAALTSNRLRGVPHGPCTTPEMGRHARRMARFDLLVLPDGLRSWRRPDVSPRAAGALVGAGCLARPSSAFHGPGVLQRADGVFLAISA